MIREYPVVGGTAAGGAGVATATVQTDKPIVGRLLAVGLTYQDSPPASTDVTVRTKGGNGPSQDVLTLANAATDGWFYPRKQIEDINGTGVEYANAYPIYEPFVLADHVELIIAQANNGDSVDAILVVEE